ncbi:MAG: ATP-binding cassette domain-containing protein [Verrucomicrobiales bacterium]
MSLLEVENLTVRYPRRRSIFRAASPAALDEVSFEIPENAIVGLIGERGCGKTTLAHCIVRLLRPQSGKILYRDNNILRLSTRAFRRNRREIQLVFENCRRSLNPHVDILTTLLESIRVYNPKLSRSQREDYAARLLTRVGLPWETAFKFPRELPHGHAERVAIARAISVDTRLLLIDDSLRALDLRPQREIVELLLGLQRELGFSCLFACHDFNHLLPVAKHALVMARGRIVESAAIDAIIDNPQHEFTKKLLASTLTLP